MSRLTSDREAEIRNRLAGATQDPLSCTWIDSPCTWIDRLCAAVAVPHYDIYTVGSDSRNVACVVNASAGDVALWANAAADIRALLDEVGALRAERDRLRAFVKRVMRDAAAVLAMMHKQGFVIEDPNDPMQKLVFSIYTDLMELSSEAGAVLCGGGADGPADAGA